MTTSKELLKQDSYEYIPKSITHVSTDLELIELYGCSDNTGELIQQPPALSTTVQVKEYQWK